MTNTTIAYRDMLAMNPRTKLDDLSDINGALRYTITSEIEAGARKGVTTTMVRWEVMEPSDIVAVNIWPMFHMDDEARTREYLILPWEDVDQSFDSWKLGTDNDQLVYAEIFAALRRGLEFGYITTNDDQRVVAWSRHN